MEGGVIEASGSSPPVRGPGDVVKVCLDGMDRGVRRGGFSVGSCGQAVEEEVDEVGSGEVLDSKVECSSWLVDGDTIPGFAGSETPN